IDSTFADAVIMNMPHDLCGSLAVLVKKPLKNMNDKFHRRVIVVQKQDAIQIWFLRLCFRLGYDDGASVGVVAVHVPTSHPYETIRHSSIVDIQTSHYFPVPSS